MAHVSLPYNFTAGTPAVADQVDANFTAITAQVNGALDATNLATPAALVDLSFEANWTHYATSLPDATQNRAQYYKDLLGVVHLQGMVRRVNAAYTLSSAVATLPAGYRPAAQQSFMAIHVDGVNRSIIRIIVGPTGVVTAFDQLAGTNTGAVGSYFYLDGITFRAA